MERKRIMARGGCIERTPFCPYHFSTTKSVSRAFDRCKSSLKFLPDHKTAGGEASSQSEKLDRKAYQNPNSENMSQKDQLRIWYDNYHEKPVSGKTVLSPKKGCKLWQSSSLDSTAHLAFCVSGVEDLPKDI